MTGWYAVYTQSGMELWARSNLWERGCEVYLPRYLKRRSHARRIDWVPRPLFSRYLFVRADPERGGTRGIDYAPGVVRLLRMGQRPSTVPDQIIAEIQGRENTDGFVTLHEEGALLRGQPVRIVTSALCDQAGLFDRMSDNQRVVVFVNLLGRLVRVHLNAEGVTADG